jgi:hypothetical protein
MLNVRNSSDALAQPIAADSDNSTFNIDHSTFPVPLRDEPSRIMRVSYWASTSMISSKDLTVPSKVG